MRGIKLQAAADTSPEKSPAFKEGEGLCNKLLTLEKPTEPSLSLSNTPNSSRNMRCIFILT